MTRRRRTAPPPPVDTVWVTQMPAGAVMPLFAYSPLLRIGAAPQGQVLIWFRVDGAGLPVAPAIDAPAKTGTTDLIVWRLSQAYLALALAEHDAVPAKA